MFNALLWEGSAGAEKNSLGLGFFGLRINFYLNWIPKVFVYIQTHHLCFLKLLSIGLKNIHLCCTLKYWFHAFLGQSPCDWGTTMHWNVFLAIFQKPSDYLVSMEKLYSNVPLSFNCVEKVLNCIKIPSRVGPCGTLLDLNMHGSRIWECNL